MAFSNDQLAKLKEILPSYRFGETKGPVAAALDSTGDKIEIDLQIFFKDNVTPAQKKVTAEELNKQLKHNPEFDGIKFSAKNDTIKKLTLEFSDDAIERLVKGLKDPDGQSQLVGILKKENVAAMLGQATNVSQSTGNSSINYNGEPGAKETLESNLKPYFEYSYLPSSWLTQNNLTPDFDKKDELVDTLETINSQLRFNSIDKIVQKYNEEKGNLQKSLTEIDRLEERMIGARIGDKPQIIEAIERKYSNGFNAGKNQAAAQAAAFTAAYDLKETVDKFTGKFTTWAEEKKENINKKPMELGAFASENADNRRLVNDYSNREEQLKKDIEDVQRAFDRIKKEFEQADARKMAPEAVEDFMKVIEKEGINKKVEELLLKIEQQAKDIAKITEGLEKQPALEASRQEAEKGYAFYQGVDNFGQPELKIAYRGAYNEQLELSIPAEVKKGASVLNGHNANAPLKLKIHDREFTFFEFDEPNAEKKKQKWAEAFFGDKSIELSGLAVDKNGQVFAFKQDGNKFSLLNQQGQEIRDKSKLEPLGQQWASAGEAQRQLEKKKARNIGDEREGGSEDATKAIAEAASKQNKVKESEIEFAPWEMRYSRLIQNAWRDNFASKNIAAGIPSDKDFHGERLRENRQVKGRIAGISAKIESQFVNYMERGMRNIGDKGKNILIGIIGGANKSNKEPQAIGEILNREQYEALVEYKNAEKDAEKIFGEKLQAFHQRYVSSTSQKTHDYVAGVRRELPAPELSGDDIKELKDKYPQEYKKMKAEAYEEAMKGNKIAELGKQVQEALLEKGWAIQTEISGKNKDSITQVNLMGLSKMYEMVENHMKDGFYNSAARNAMRDMIKEDPKAAATLMTAIINDKGIEGGLGDNIGLRNLDDYEEKMKANFRKQYEDLGKANRWEQGKKASEVGKVAIVAPTALLGFDFTSKLAGFAMGTGSQNIGHTLDFTGGADHVFSTGNPEEWGLSTFNVDANDGLLEGIGHMISGYGTDGILDTALMFAGDIGLTMGVSFAIYKALTMLEKWLDRRADQYQSEKAEAYANKAWDKFTGNLKESHDDLKKSSNKRASKMDPHVEGYDIRGKDHKDGKFGTETHGIEDMAIIPGELIKIPRDAKMKLALGKEHIFAEANSNAGTDPFLDILNEVVGQDAKGRDIALKNYMTKEEMNGGVSKLKYNDLAARIFNDARPMADKSGRFTRIEGVASTSQQKLLGNLRDLQQEDSRSKPIAKKKTSVNINKKREGTFAQQLEAAANTPGASQTI